jgi:hypothetical protein
MGNFRFYRRLHPFPGLTLNLAKHGASVSIGVRGAHLTFGQRGVTRTVGIPGSGIFYTSRRGYHTGFHSAHVETPVSPQTQARADTVAGLGVSALLVLVIGIIIGALLR